METGASRWVLAREAHSACHPERTVPSSAEELTEKGRVVGAFRQPQLAGGQGARDLFYLEVTGVSVTGREDVIGMALTRKLTWLFSPGFWARLSSHVGPQAATLSQRPQGAAWQNHRCSRKP